jgi:hypothetical protein
MFLAIHIHLHSRNEWFTYEVQATAHPQVFQRNALKGIRVRKQEVKGQSSHGIVSESCLESSAHAFRRLIFLILILIWHSFPIPKLFFVTTTGCELANTEPRLRVNVALSIFEKANSTIVIYPRSQGDRLRISDIFCFRRLRESLKEFGEHYPPSNYNAPIKIKNLPV